MDHDKLKLMTKRWQDVITGPEWRDVPRFRSSYEYDVAVMLTVMDIEWEYETLTWDLSNGEKYVPDFWLNKLGVIIEVKGGWKYERGWKPLLLAHKLHRDLETGRVGTRAEVMLAHHWQVENSWESRGRLYHVDYPDDWCDAATAWVRFPCGHWQPQAVDCGNYDKICRYVGCMQPMHDGFVVTHDEIMRLIPR